MNHYQLKNQDGEVVVEFMTATTLPQGQAEVVFVPPVPVGGGGPGEPDDIEP